MPFFERCLFETADRLQRLNIQPLYESPSILNEQSPSILNKQSPSILNNNPSSILNNNPSGILYEQSSNYRLYDNPTDIHSLVDRSLVQQVQTLFHLKKYSCIVSLTRCPNFKGDCCQFHFCDCCSDYNNFIRNYAEYINHEIRINVDRPTSEIAKNEDNGETNGETHGETNEKSYDSECCKFENNKFFISSRNRNLDFCCMKFSKEKDSFCHYIIALIHENSKYLFEKHMLIAIRKNPLFYEALRHLMKYLTDKNSLITIYENVAIDEIKSFSSEQNLLKENSFSNSVMMEKNSGKPEITNVRFFKNRYEFDKLLLWEFFKIEYFVYFYVDLGLSKNQIIILEKKDTKKVPSFDVIDLVDRLKEISFPLAQSMKNKNFDTNENVPNQSNFKVSEDKNNTMFKISEDKNTVFKISEDKNTVNKNTMFKISEDENTMFKISEDKNTVFKISEDKNTVFKISEDKNTFELSEKVKLFLNNLLGAYYYSKKWYNRSLKHFKKAVYVDYLDFYSHILYIKEEKHALSQLAYFLIERDPFSIEGLISLGNCFSLRKEYAKAVKYFKRALKFRPDMIYLNNLIGHEHLDHNRPDQAIKFFQKCKDYRSMCGLGQCYLKLEMNHVAIEMFKRSLELNDKNVYGWHSLGNIFRKMNKYKQSIMCFETIYKLKDPLGLLLVGEVYKEQKKFDLAADYFKKYLEYKDDPKIKKFLDEYYKQRSKITQ